jgi:hypothetical protein
MNSPETEKMPQKTTDATNPEIDSAPFLKWNFKLNEKTGKYQFQSLELSDQSELTEQNMNRALKKSTGSTNAEMGERILNNAAHGMTAERQDQRLNQVSCMLSALHPRDEAEAMLFGQFLALQDSGLKCLRLANLPEQGFYHVERLLQLATKLMNTANQTMQTVLKYRSGGQQVVQILHVHNEGQAVVAQNLSQTGTGGLRK